MKRGKSGGEIEAQRVERKVEKGCCFLSWVSLINIPFEPRELWLVSWQLQHRDPAEDPVNCHSYHEV